MRTANLITGCVAAIAMLVVGAMALKNKRDLRLIAVHQDQTDRSSAVARDIATRGQNAIIIFGDSIVQRAPFPSDICGAKILNAGISGARSSMLVPLIETMAATSIHPRRIIIAIGVNDAAIKYWNEVSFSAIYETLLRLASSIAPTAVATVAPINTSLEVGMTVSDSARDRINETIIATAAKLSIPVIRLDDIPWRTLDGVHAEPSSYSGWIERVVTALPECHRD
jgi:lysophospholipase L1-like esterase